MKLNHLHLMVTEVREASTFWKGILVYKMVAAMKG